MKRQFSNRLLSRLAKSTKRRAKARLQPHLKVELLEERRLMAREIGQLNDLQFAEAMRGSKILASDQVLYMTKNSPEAGIELNMYDTILPIMVDDVWPGAQSSNPHDVVIHDGKVYFVANNGLVGDELWFNSRIGGVTGSQLVADILPGPTSSGIDNLISAGGELFFTASDGTRGNELWKLVNGNPALVKDIASGSASSTPDNFVVIGNRVYFSADDGVAGRELWTSDGTTAGTVMVANVRAGANGSSPKYITDVNGLIYFAADSDGNGVNELWRAGPTGPVQILQSGGQSIDAPTKLFNFNGTLVFTATTTAAGRELWKLEDATGRGVLLQDLYPGAQSSNPTSFAILGNALYFIAIAGLNSNLCKTDGTASGTVSTGFLANGSSPLVNIGGAVYYGSRNELHSFDGSVRNTITEFPSPGRVDDIVAFRNQVFFTDAGYREDLWYLENNVAMRTTDTNRYTGSPNINEFLDINGALFVDADVTFGKGVARVDPNSLEYEGIYVHNDQPRSLVNVGGTLFYFAGRDLYKNAGTSSSISTLLMTSITSSLTGLRELTNVNGVVFFSITDSLNPGLAKTDGTAGGTVFVKAFPTGASAPSSLININGTLYFVANDGTTGLELWKSDGTAAGTVLVSNIAAGSASSNPVQLTNVGGLLYFAADDGNNGVELWRSDGTTAGTVLVRNIAAGAVSSSPISLKNVGGVLYFSADDVVSGRELWKSDGTTAGTVLVRDVRTGAAGSNPTELTEVGGRLYFTADDGSKGIELWMSNGTFGSTALVSDIVAGATSSYPTRLMNFNGALYFTPDIRPVGQRLWKSDGTTSGTKEVVNAANRGGPQVASKMTAANGKLFFLGRNNQFGIELFAMGDADYGDAAGSDTSALNFGGASFANGPMLGVQRDATENDGVPSALANSDDLDGIDDEDGLLAPMVGTVGGTITASLLVSNATSKTRLTAYLDFDQDGNFDDAFERVAYQKALVNGTNNLTFNVPTTAKLGTTTARFRISDNQNTFGLLLALSGETEDHLVTLERVSTITLPTTGANDIVIRRSGTNIEVVNRINSAVLFTDSLASLSRLIIVGANAQSDTVLVDYVTGGFFSLLGGLEIDGQGGADVLTINSSGTGQATYSQASSNRPRLTITQAAQSNSVIYTNFETQTFNGLQSFVTTAAFDVGTNSITINSVDPVSLANTTSIAGGTLTAPAFTLAASQTLSGFGTVAGNFSGLTNSILSLSGDLSIGNAASTSGFTTLGNIATQSNVLTLLDANEARLGASTAIGNGSNAGRLVAAKGLSLPSSNQITGVGLIDTPNDNSFAFVNNGTVNGSSTSNRLTINGYVTGTGSLNRVTIAGTASPGANLINASYGEVNYAGALMMELGGTTAGTGYDQVIHSGVATLSGTLDVRLVNGFVPSVGDQFTLLVAGSIVGRFTNVVLPAAPSGSLWEVGYTATTVNLQLAALALSITDSSISENGGATTATVTRNSYDLTQALTVNIASSDTSEATVPATVTILAGQASATFTIAAVDDALLDGSQVVSITVSSTGLASDSKSLTVTDFETISLAIVPSSISEKNGSATGTVTRSNTDIDASIVVTLVSSDTSEATVPATVTIPAGQASAAFTITAVDDALLDGTQTVQVTASRVGYIGGSANLDVTDSENLTLSIDVSSISEAGGSALGKVVRSNTDIGSPLQITLLSSDTTEATVPASVIIPANQSQAFFTISAVDDALLDGTQTVTITASHTSYISGNSTLAVTDAESLTLTVNATSMSESGGLVTGTLARSNTDNSAPITVAVVSSDTTEATVPTAVIIPAGQASVTFSITAVDDTLLDGTQRVTISASLAGYQSSSRFVDVLDSETITIAITPGSISEKGGTASGTVTRSNTDIAASVTVLLSSNDTTEAAVPSVVTIAAGQSQASFTITAVDDNLLDGAQSVQISASSAGYFGSTRPLTILDFEQLQLSINPSSISENSGTAVGTVTRPNTDNNLPLTVTLLSDDTTEATVPASVVIPAGQASATFTITAVDDSLQDGTQTANISASAVGYVSNTKPIDIMDSVSLSLIIGAANISEKGGVATATITRSNSNIDAPLTVQINSNDSTEATVPASVIIPANQSSVTFTITAVDDTLLDGNQVVSITVSAAGYSSAAKTVLVDDYELLEVTVVAASISEQGGVTTGRITRTNTDIAQAITVNLALDDTSEAAVPATVTIPAGQTSATFTITAGDDALLDGTQHVVLTASSAGYISAATGFDVTDSESLSISINATSISENGGTATATITRSNTDIGSPLAVQLTGSDATEVSVPASAIIPAGQSSVTFIINAVDDSLLDGSQSVSFGASAAGYASATKNLLVDDYELLELAITAAAISEEGGVTTGRVTRTNTDISQAITVSLVLDDTSEANVPGSVTIPAGQASTTFAIAAVDDTLLDGTQRVVLTASSTGYISATSNLDVTDSESLSVSIDKASVSENGGTATATVTRNNTDIGSPLTVQLLSSDATELAVPTSIVIPANQTSLSFNISAVDDALLDGSQQVSLSVSAAGYASAAKPLLIDDYELLEVTIAAGAISEQSGATTGTITRTNTDIDQPITVSLVLDDTSEASVPTTVTIPAGQTSATFAIMAVDDALLDGTQSVVLTANSPGYIAATRSLEVTDSESLSVSIDKASISEKGGSATATVTRSNMDTAAPLAAQILSSDTTELLVPASVIIPAGQSSVTFTIIAVDDELLDGSQQVGVSASAVGYVSDSQALLVEDYELLQVTISAASISEQAGVATGTVARLNTNIDQAVTVSLASDDSGEADVPATVIIPAGQASVSFVITAVDDTLLDGTQRVLLTATSSGYISATGGLDVRDNESLSVSIERASISEKGGTSSATVVRSNTDIELPLTVQLQPSDATELAVPSSVIIPAGQASVTFVIAAVDDALLDGTQVVSISASTVGYNAGQAALSVTDWEELVLTIDKTVLTENGGTARGTIRRSNSDTGAALTVNLLNEDSTELSMPATVVLPANQSSVEFDITALDDGLFDGDQSVQLTVSADGYNDASKLVKVTDYVLLSLVVESDQISERGGQALATISRSNSDIGAQLVVQLDVSDASEITVPQEITIPANANSVSFQIHAIDDTLLDGLQTVSVIASTAGYQASSDTLDVSDLETLTLTIDVTAISEKNGEAVGTIARSNTDNTAPLVVSLASNDTSEAGVPASVVIPAGQGSVTFVIRAVNDTQVDGPQSVEIAAVAAGYVGSSRSLTVQDDDRSFPWQSPRNPLDVNDSGQVTAIDALLVINGINTRMVLTPELPDPFIPANYVDVNGDGSLTPIDALLVINELNNPRSSEGEGVFVVLPTKQKRGQVTFVDSTYDEQQTQIDQETMTADRLKNQSHYRLSWLQELPEK